MSRKGRYRVEIQSEVIDDLDGIYSFVLEDSPSRAKAFIRSLQRKILSLRDLPFRGSRARLLEDAKISDQIRFIEHKGYLIFYTVAKKAVIVLHVTRPGQDWLRLFLK